MAEFEPELVAAVASAIGQHMILRESPEQIAMAALAAEAGRRPAYRVQGYCPLGCGETLILAAGGCVTCSRLACPRPDAVTSLLDDRESEHIVVFGETEFTVRHPLRERLDDALMDCELHKDIAAMAGPPVKPGTYRARWADYDAAAPGYGRWTWEEVRSGS